MQSSCLRVGIQVNRTTLGMTLYPSVSSPPFLYFFSLLIPGIEPGILRMLAKHSTIELQDPVVGWSLFIPSPDSFVVGDRG